MNNYVLLFQCKDQKGIVARISDFIFRQDGNIITADQYSTDPKSGYFFIRLEFVVSAKPGIKDSLEKGLGRVARGFNAKFSLCSKDKPLKMGILVSRPGHCLAEILYLRKAGELFVDIPFVASNFEGHAEFVEQHDLPFYFLPATKKDRQERELLRLARGTDFLALARYMLILSRGFLNSYGRDIINIHHGFLPSFKGANPYLQALAGGVKVIGATSHFVSEKLDCGPIIAQEVERVSHKDNLADLIRKGKNLEKKALIDAIRSYIDYRVIKHANKTIVF